MNAYVDCFKKRRKILKKQNVSEINETATFLYTESNVYYITGILINSLFKMLATVVEDESKAPFR